MTTAVGKTNPLPAPTPAPPAGAALLIAALGAPISAAAKEPPPITNRDAFALSFRTGHTSEGRPTKRLKAMVSPSAHLLEACRKGELVEVRKLMQSGAKVGSSSWRGYNALQEAAFEGHLPIICCLVDEFGVDPALVTKEHGSSALHLSSAQGHLDVVRYLAGKKKLSVREPNTEGADSFDLACANDRVAVVRYFVSELNVSIHEVDGSGNNFLHLTCAEGCEQTASYFLSQGGWSLCLARNADRDLPIHLALRGDKKLVVEICLSFYKGELIRLSKAPLEKEWNAVFHLMQFHAHLASHPKASALLKPFEALHLNFVNWIWKNSAHLLLLVEKTIKSIEASKNLIGENVIESALSCHRFLFHLRCSSLQRVPLPKGFLALYDRLQSCISIASARQERSELATLDGFIRISREKEIFALLTNCMGYSSEGRSAHFNQNCLNVLGHPPPFISECGLLSGADLETLGYDFAVDYWIDQVESKPGGAAYRALQLAIVNLEKALSLLPQKVGSYHLAEALKLPLLALKTSLNAVSDKAAFTAWCKKMRESQALICHALIRAFLHQFDDTFSVEITSLEELRAVENYSAAQMFQLRSQTK